MFPPYKLFKILFFCCFLYPALASALPDDKKQPVHTQAAYSHADLKQHIVTHQGSVITTQGTTQLTGDTVTVYMNDKNEIIKAIAVGKPATYRTLTAEDKPEFYAEGDEIHYLVDKQLILLIGNAKVRQGNDTYAGPRLEYQIEQEVIISPKSSQGRASMVIQPKPSTDPKTP
jgi:lipopolysaccharide export system protein LptA